MSIDIYDLFDRHVDETNLRELQTKPHRVVCHITARTEMDDKDEWRPVNVSEATVRVLDPGTPAELNLTTVAPIYLSGENRAGDVIPILDWGPETEVEITPWGTWLKVEQYVYLPGSDKDVLGGDNNPFVVPWGAFVVTEVATDRNTQTITAKDALAMLDFREYVPMAKARVVKKKTPVKELVDELLDAVWPAGTDPWLPVTRWDVHPQGGVGVLATSTEQYDGTDRRALVRAILSRREFNLAPKGDDYDLAMVIQALPQQHNPDKPDAHFVIRREFDLKEPPRATTRDIKAGQGLVALKETKNREGLVNRAIVSWESQDKVGTIAKYRFRYSVDLIATTNEEYSKVHVGQRLGLQTQDESASGVVSLDSANQRGRRMILKSLFEAVRWDVECSPLYGLYVDDVVSMKDAYGNTGYGRVMGMTVGLTQSSRWTLEVRPLNVVDPRSFGAAKLDITLSDITEWKTIYSPDVSEGMKKLKGWSATGGTLSAMKTGLRLETKGDAATVQSAIAYPDNSYHVARASVEIGAAPEKMQVRVGIGGNFGPWETILKKTSATVSSDKANGSPQKISGKFGVEIEFKGLGANGTSGLRGGIELNGLTVEVPGIAREDTTTTGGGTGGATGGAGAWVPRPDSDRGHARSPRQMVEYAKSRVGDYWTDGRCLAFASVMYWGGAYNDYDGTGFGGTYAKYVWLNKPASATTWPKDTSPPIGAWCVWNSPTGGNAGHIGLSIGGGWMISATGGNVGRQKISSFGRNPGDYFGAVEPY